MIGKRGNRRLSRGVFRIAPPARKELAFGQVENKKKVVGCQEETSTVFPNSMNDA
jgi:hypothetical protein